MSHHDDHRIREIAQTLQVIQTLWLDGKVDDVASYYTPDAVVTGEGVPVVIRGPEQIREGVSGLVAANRDAVFDIRIARAFADDVAETWITVRAPSSDLAMRALLVWTRGAGDTWRITSEMFASGSSF